MRNKRSVACMLALSLCIITVGCGQKHTTTGNPTIDSMTMDQLGENLVRALSERSTYKQTAENLQIEVEDLRKKVQGVQIADPEFPAVDKVEDDTGRVTFKKPSDYIKLPEPLHIQGDVPIEVKNMISMGGQNGLTLNMAPIWTYRIEGNKLWIASMSGVYGVLVIGKIEGTFEMSYIDNLFDGTEGQEEERDAWDRIIKPYIAKTKGVKKMIPADPGKGKGIDEQITCNGAKVGRQVILNTSVEDESAVIRVGAFVTQGIAVVYTFMYETALDDSNEAIILSAIQDIKVQNQAISVAH